MNKNDYYLITILLVISLSFLFIINSNKKKPSIAQVYYNNKIILTLELSKDIEQTIYGDNGKMILEVKDGSIRVKDENSKYHLCSKQGFINSSNDMLVCLPNKVVIKLVDNELDGVVR